MATRHKVILLGALAIAYGCGHIYLQQRYSDTVLDRIRALEPQSAAAVRALPTGAPVLVEGTVAETNPKHNYSLVAYVRSSELKLSRNEPGHWVEDDWVAPRLQLNIAGGTATLEPGYALRKTSVGRQTKLYHYSGFDRGAKVFAVGTRTAAGTIRARALYGGTRDRFLFTSTGETWVTYFTDLFAIGLGTLMIGVTVWATRGRPVAPRRAVRVS
ncbi:hypothetical protein LJ737_22640 [Hymenobacter sp. 15J16-1T3B]|uniref:hypothetical protein n=1 Tax=Hymenobacter sp. 15J16-1T3B TaxID=2886941 RepID=UPI001D0F6347|nr:hypothetical protein [Hymenobacter sp. 15J16-1T3B]MCC3160053.1 hypothetical protein [Hymenobacter sp. 15J16-1T3B]